VTLELEYRRNSATPRGHGKQFKPLLEPLFGAELFPGSLNLWSAKKLRLPEPVEVLNGLWHLWPVVLEERINAVAARRSDAFEPRLLEVFSHVEVAAKLGLTPGARVGLRVLPGESLAAFLM